ncbi:Hsp20/alpha crystallin family protein [Pseudonocardia sp.]|jgi:HSP20 family protein|uniref:Hsp20/alpha crystallin family protein n=1 Tax=Pseudonocardia sp. TaxID=60912 RepID=UPI00260DCC23|nr:Hsp20/alpha crystallin family protein [Pseudonocardia sp.]MCW2718762.1 heat-shock protein Hsp20 [Pseudonocardia sp.]MDT7613445.1 hypothetical protein [Pseudonocardiales bacterium]
MALPKLHERTGRSPSAALDDDALLSRIWRPAADVEETDDAYLVEIELPGVSPDDVSIEVERNELMVTGEIKQRERVGILRRRARPVGRFEYRVHLPGAVEPDNVRASLSNGVLTVEVPKSENARPRRIPIG